MLHLLPSTLNRWTRPRPIASLVLAAVLTLPASAFVPDGSAWALSEIKQQDIQAPDSDDTIEKAPLPPVGTVPLPDPITATPPADDSPTDQNVEPDETAPDGGLGGDTISRPEVDPNAPLPEVNYDVGQLPAPVKRMRELIIEATKTGDLEKLRPLLGTREGGTQLSLGGFDGDPIEFLKEISGDSEGQEILAILEEVLGAGYVHLDAGKPEELYVWPYFFALPLDRLTPPQRVELFKIVTAGDYEDMKTYGAYIFYRVGITPDGRWTFFVAGD